MKSIKRANSHNLRLIKIIAVPLLLLTISGCSTYPNKFKCGDAKGLGCTMLRDVDMQIDSGQIEEVYKNKKCKGGTCASSILSEGLNLKKQDTADSYQDEQAQGLDDDNLNNNLRF